MPECVRRQDAVAQRRRTLVRLLEQRARRRVLVADDLVDEADVEERLRDTCLVADLALDGPDRVLELS